jgi:hypothetical protein
MVFRKSTAMKTMKENIETKTEGKVFSEMIQCSAHYQEEFIRNFQLIYRSCPPIPPHLFLETVVTMRQLLKKRKRVFIYGFPQSRILFSSACNKDEI